MLKELKKYGEYIKERINVILSMSETNCEISDVLFGGAADEIKLYLKSKEVSDHVEYDESRAREVLKTVFPFALSSEFFNEVLFIKEENEADLLIILSLDNDALKLYYELRK